MSGVVVVARPSAAEGTLSCLPPPSPDGVRASHVFGASFRLACVRMLRYAREQAGRGLHTHHLFCVVLCDARVCPGVSAHTKNGEGQSPAARPPTPGALRLWVGQEGGFQ